MTDLQKIGPEEQNVEEAIASLKNWSYLLRYGRMGKPRFCPFRISNDETAIQWCIKREVKQLPFSQVSKIMRGQRTVKFQRYPQPEKEHQSFSLLYGTRSLDLICKNKGDAETWVVSLQALISRNNNQITKSTSTVRYDSDSSTSNTQRKSLSIASDSGSDICNEDLGKNETFTFPINNPQSNNLGKSFSSRSSLSRASSSSSQGPRLDDVESLHDVFIWGEGTGDGLLGGGTHKIGNTNSTKMDSLLPKALKRSVAFDARKVCCGSKHAVLVTKQGEVYSWGEGTGGKLGHGTESDIPIPKLIDDLSRSYVEMVACGENHTCALTQSGDLYTWGEGIHNSGWIPRKIGQLEGVNISFISCGPWHSACVSSNGILFTFGDGTFGALGHGNSNTAYYPRPVESLKGFKTFRVSCGVWHTAAVIEIDPEPSGSIHSRKLFTWGSGDKGQLGHDDKDPRFLPSCIVSLYDKNFCQVACGHYTTFALTTSGHVYTMGPTSNPPVCIVTDSYVQEISCGAHHVAILNSKSEIYTWGKGSKGQLGHGDNKDRETPTLVEALGETRAKSVVCCSNVTVSICLRKEVRTADLPMCSSCHAQFNFKRKRHNCYNCGLVFCKACSGKRSLRASLAPNADRSYRVCEDCYNSLHKEEIDAKSSLNSNLNVNLNLPPKFTSRRSGSEGGDRKLWDMKSQGLLSRLSAFDSFRRSTSQHIKAESSQESSNNTYAVSPQNQSSSNSPSVFEYLGGIAGSAIGSQAASPVSMKPGLSYSASLSNAIASLAFPEPKGGDESKRKDDNFIKEISTLREQVEYLSQKTQIIESELKRTSIQLKEANQQARDEEEKNKAANEKIESLTTELEDLKKMIGSGSYSGRRTLERQLSF